MKYLAAITLVSSVLLSCAGRSAGDQFNRNAGSSLMINRLSRVPLDTINAFAGGKSVMLLIYEYYDSLPDKLIKDFSVVDVNSNVTVFRPKTDRFFLKEEVDPLNGVFDFLTMVPVYSVSTLDPLTIDLIFLTHGDNGVSRIAEVTYNFYEQGRVLQFLSYQFEYQEKWMINYILRFPPCNCGVSQQELFASFEKAKQKDLTNDNGMSVLTKSFCCFLNGNNDRYQSISREFDEAFQKASTEQYAYTYHPFISYFDDFILITNSR